jgi:hypothetical protein
MINSSITTSSMNNVKARVELYNGSTLVQTCTCSNYLQDFVVDRAGENHKFFGFGICHKLKVSLIDLEKTLNVAKGYAIKIGFSIDNGKTFYYPYPKFYATNVQRDDSAGLIEIEAYDALNIATEHTVSELVLGAHTPADYLLAIIDLLDLASVATKGGISLATATFTTDYAETLNFNGNENIRVVLNRLAEITQTIYYVDRLNRLVICKLNNSLAYSLRINKVDYFSLTTSPARKLTTICHATELGDNVEATQEPKDATQFIRENEFWALRTDIATLLDNALAAVGGVTLSPFVCEWAGNFALEPCDKIIVITDDNSAITSYVLNDTIVYDGTLMETTQWDYSDDAVETFSNPTSLGDVLNQTYARVDKTNQTIELMAQENKDKFSNVQLTTNGITATVAGIQETTKQLETNADGLNEEVTEVKKQVSNFKLESDKALLEFKTDIETNGVSKVSTTTGFTFNETGLTVSKTDSEISTTITEDGMTVSKAGEELLIANNQGVVAKDLHANTYLWIGDNSRFEDQGNRTACFWVGN